MKEKILSLLRTLTGHEFTELVPRGNSAIDSALSILPKAQVLLIPEEGGWLHYQKGPKKLGIKTVEVKCDEAKISLQDLKEKLAKFHCSAFLYQNPGGYFAEQPMREIYELCHKHNCLVILDVSGAIGTKLCAGKFADIMIGSFGEGKLVNAKGGGFISCKEEELFNRLKPEKLKDEPQLEIINEQLTRLPQRIKFLSEKIKEIRQDLKDLEIVHPKDLGFVMAVKYKNDAEKEKIMFYCQTNHLPFTECPRYIRLKQLATSIEVKQLEENHYSNGTTSEIVQRSL